MSFKLRIFSSLLSSSLFRNTFMFLLKKKNYIIDVPAPVLPCSMFHRENTDRMIFLKCQSECGIMLSGQGLNSLPSCVESLKLWFYLPAFAANFPWPCFHPQLDFLSQTELFAHFLSLPCSLLCIFAHATLSTKSKLVSSSCYSSFAEIKSLVFKIKMDYQLFC